MVMKVDTAALEVELQAIRDRLKIFDLLESDPDHADIAFVVWMNQRGVSGYDFARAIRLADNKFSYRNERYAAAYPDEWAAYRAACRILGKQPH
jgi:hypothetical protein